MSAILLFKSIGNKHDVYKGKDYMKTFCESVREHALEIINFIKQKNDVANKKAAGAIWKWKKKSVIFVKKNLKINMWKIKNIVKLEIVAIIQGIIEVLCIAYVM